MNRISGTYQWGRGELAIHCILAENQEKMEVCCWMGKYEWLFLSHSTQKVQQFICTVNVCVCK